MVENSSRFAPAYVALPEQGRGPGVIVLHAWWGLNDGFKRVCDRLAHAGLVAVSPDLYAGKVATTIDQAEQLLDQHDAQAAHARILDAATYLHEHHAMQGDGFGVIGFSMGAAWALRLSTLLPQQTTAVVVFYGSDLADFTEAKAAYLGHYAEDDEWEPIEGVRQLHDSLREANRDVTFYAYPATKHWFFEEDRPEYNAAAAHLAWERTIAF